MHPEMEKPVVVLLTSHLIDTDNMPDLRQKCK